LAEFHTIEGHDESHDALRDPGLDLADIRNQSSVIHDAVEDSLHRHLIGFMDLERYCAELVCMSLKERSYGLLVKFDVAVCYS
jgi:hypothetical protein